MRIGKNTLSVLLLIASVATGAPAGTAASAASTGTSAAGTSRASGTAGAAPDAAVAISYAEDQLGKPYQWGATGPGAFDCSGLTYMAWLQAKVNIGRTSQEQWANLPHISEQDLQPGDLVFYVGALEPGEAPPGHVALYIGHGQILEAYATGYPIRITAMRPGAWGYAKPWPDLTEGGSPVVSKNTVSVLLLAASVVSAVVPGGSAAAVAPAGSADAAASGSGGAYNMESLEDLWEQADGSDTTAVNAACHAMQESSGERDASSPNPDGGTNYGLWQLDTRGVGAGYSVTQLENPLINAQITVHATNGGADWSHWSTPGCWL
jgi:hypothetical protein